MKFEVNGYEFSSNFDSGNLAKVDLVQRNSNEHCHHPRGRGRGNFGANYPDAEFNAWTKMDCEGTQFQNSNRTWFHFRVKSCHRNAVIKINILNLNKQGKLFNYGMAPVFKEVRNCCQGTICQCCQWRRVKHSPKYKHSDGQSSLSFIHFLPQDTLFVTYFAFTYPFSYTECQAMLKVLDEKFSCVSKTRAGNLYYHRELLCKSSEGNRVDLITLSSHHGITDMTDDLIDDLYMFPERNRCKKFSSLKKIVFISSRVHPGETPSSHVFNGLLQFLLSNEPEAVLLREKYIFKMIPMLNPDGVIHGHYRTDMRGLNLNRFYVNPNPVLHPSIYATRKLILYHHSLSNSTNLHTSAGKSNCESTIHLYMDFHGHATKRGCFIYGNHFENSQKMVECMLFPKVLSINCPTFDFESCNFSQKNMSQTDKHDRTSKEGSGRVSVFRMTGLIRSYTLEFNYNSGKPDLMSSSYRKSLYSGVKYTPQAYAEIGRTIGISILDLTEDNSKSLLYESMWENIMGIRQWLTKYVRYINSSHKHSIKLKVICKNQGSNSTPISGCSSPTKMVSPRPKSHSGCCMKQKVIRTLSDSIKSSCFPSPSSQRKLLGTSKSAEVNIDQEETDPKHSEKTTALVIKGCFRRKGKKITRGGSNVSNQSAPPSSSSSKINQTCKKRTLKKFRANSAKSYKKDEHLVKNASGRPNSV